MAACSVELEVRLGSYANRQFDVCVEQKVKWQHPYFKNGRSILERLFFFIFVRNKISVTQLEMLGLVLIARYLQFASFSDIIIRQRIFK